MSDHGSICLKTGCLLEVDGDAYWGDLHCLGRDILIFNATLGDRQAPQPVDPDNYYGRAALTCEGPFFERRGVFILLTAACVPNTTLQQHFLAWGGPR